MNPVKHSASSEAFVLTIKSELCSMLTAIVIPLLYPMVLNFLAYMKQFVVYYSYDQIL